MHFLGRVSERAIFAVFNGSRTRQGNVLEWVAQGASSSIANGHDSVHLGNRNLVHQFHGVAAVLSQFVLCVCYKQC